MAAHIWDTKKFLPSTFMPAMQMAVLCHDAGLDFETTCRLVGYYLERCRQDRWQSAQIFLSSCIKSKHRYAKGKHKINYLKAGMALIAAYAPCAHLDEGAPANLVLDKVIDEQLVTYQSDKHGIYEWEHKWSPQESESGLESSQEESQ